MRSTISNVPKVETWYPAVFARRSRRSYKTKSPSAESLKRLDSTCRAFVPFPEARAVLIQEGSDAVFRGIVGRYGKIDNAPSYVAFIGDLASPRVQEAVGYTGEGIVLEATALELGTCWVGGYFDPEAVAQQITLDGRERVLAVTPVGLVPETFTFQERIMSGFGGMHRRKPLKQLLTGMPTEDWMSTALEAARAAPSAVNRQPWRFDVSEKAVSIGLAASRDTYRISRRLDCGIAMLHLELGARHEGASVDWSYPPGFVARLSPSR